MTTKKKLRFHLKDLQQPARIIIDRWGIPHIQAETSADLFFAQGFNAARDRLWQIDLWTIALTWMGAACILNARPYEKNGGS